MAHQSVAMATPCFTHFGLLAGVTASGTSALSVPSPSHCVRVRACACVRAYEGEGEREGV